MRLFEKILVVINGILVIGILVAIFGFFNNSVENCWDKYGTEDQAIIHCEKHNG
jgi:hypothetical protein